MVMKLKNLNCDETNKTQIVMKLKNWKGDKTKKLKLSQTQKLKLWQNSKAYIVTKLELWQISIYDKKNTLKGSFSKHIWHLENQWDVVWAAFCDLRDVRFWSHFEFFSKFDILVLSHIKCWEFSFFSLFNFFVFELYCPYCHYCRYCHYFGYCHYCRYCL